MHAPFGQRRTRIGLVSAVLRPTTHNPYMLPERGATADILSNGRVDFGFGRGSTPYMTEAFGVRKEESLGIANEALEAGMKMFENEHFPGFKGKHFDLPARHVLPRPVQNPHPPLWIAASNLSTYEYA